MIGYEHFYEIPKYHIVWIPKYRKKSIYKGLRIYLGDTLKDLVLQKECKIEEGHLPWNQFMQLLEAFPLPKPKIVHNV